MEIKFNNANSISVKKGPDNKPQYIVNMGTILYNDTPYRLDNLRIPIYNREFFNDASSEIEFAVINVYYKIPQGEFIFENVGFYRTIVQSTDAPVILNLIPIAQFVLRKEGRSYVVDHINEYSKMATFIISDSLVQGETGLRGPLGFTGAEGHIGVIGETGVHGDLGHTGPQGDTGVGSIGYTGMQGPTGYMPDPSMWLYLKFKSDDLIQTDYSVYERDCTWGITGGLGNTGGTGGLTGGNSFFSREEGIVDNCHVVFYQGGASYYKRNMYLALTGLPNSIGSTGGSFSAWVNLNVPPVADFSWNLKEDRGTFLYRFYDDSLMQPISWSWDFGDGTFSTAQNPYHQYSAIGEYLVKLTVTNNYGSAIKYRFLNIVDDDLWDIIIDW